MKWTIKLLDAPERIRVDLSGVFSLQDAALVNADIIGQLFWREGISLLINDTLVEIGNIRPSDMESVAKIMGLNNNFGKSRIAIVGASDVQFGLARQFQVKAEARTTAVVCVFRNEPAALGWLATDGVIDQCKGEERNAAAFFKGMTS